MPLCLKKTKTVVIQLRRKKINVGCIGRYVLLRVISYLQNAPSTTADVMVRNTGYSFIGSCSAFVQQLILARSYLLS